MLRAVGYVRVSTDEQAKEGLSLPSQAEKIRAYASLYSIDLAGGIEADEGVSAKTLDRPGLMRALAAIDRGDADGLVIAKLDRLSRSVADWSELIKKYFGERPGKKLWSVTDSIDTTTAGGRLVLNVLMTVFQWEREIISERTRDQLGYRISTGSRTGKVLYGKSIDPEDPRRSKRKKLPVGLVEHPDEARAIALMVEMRGRPSATFREIAAELTRRGIPTKEGRPKWDHSSVRQILIRHQRGRDAQG